VLGSEFADFLITPLRSALKSLKLDLWLVAGLCWSSGVFFSVAVGFGDTVGVVPLVGRSALQSWSAWPGDLSCYDFIHQASSWLPAQLVHILYYLPFLLTRSY
jgi:hypothetical protein